MPVFVLGLPRAGTTLVAERLARHPRVCNRGELDLIAREEDGTIVFVEVKTRSGPGYGGAEAVTGRKLARLRRAAARWLEGRPAAPVRFDVVVFTAAGRGFDMDVYEGVEHGAR